MSRKRYYPLVIVAAAVVAVWTTSASAHPGQSTVRGDLVAGASVAVEITQFKTATVGNDKVGAANKTLERKASSSREATPTPSTLFRRQ